MRLAVRVEEGLGVARFPSGERGPRGGSLAELVRADIPTLGFPETFPRYHAVGGTWAVGTRRLEVGAGTCWVGEVVWSAEVGSVTWVRPVTLTSGVGLRGSFLPRGHA